MTRSAPVRFVLALPVLLGACRSGQDPSALQLSADQTSERPPNIVVLLADDQRFDALGAAGNPIVRTPHLDRLAAEGVRFANAFCTTSICPTSRASFLTGQHVARHGITGFGSGLTALQLAATWPGMLAASGYHTAFVGKWGLGGELPTAWFDIFRGFAGQGRYFLAAGKPSAVDAAGPPPYVDPRGHRHLTAYHGEVAAHLLESAELEEPFLLQLSFKAPHAQDGEEVPFQFDPRHADLYAGVPIPPPLSATETAFEALPEMLRESEGRIRWRQRFASQEARQESVRSYYRLVTGIDEVVGSLRQSLARRGVEGRTIIVFSSDNGFFFGEHGLAGKWFPFEESIRIPLLVFDPLLPAGRRGSVVEDMVLNIDLAPTLLELAGAPVPPRIQGRSLVPALRGLARRSRKDWYYEHPYDHPRIPRSEALRTEHWKLIRYFGDGFVVEQLFDLAADPYELVDLSSDPRQGSRLEALRTRLESRRAAAR